MPAHKIAIHSGPDIGRAISALRRARGLTQEELAELAGLSPGYVAQIESGRTSPLIEHELRALRRLGAEISVEKRTTDHA